MKTHRISDENHRKLRASLGTLMVQTGKMQKHKAARALFPDHSNCLFLMNWYELLNVPIGEKLFV